MLRLDTFARCFSPPHAASRSLSACVSGCSHLLSHRSSFLSVPRPSAASSFEHLSSHLLSSPLRSPLLSSPLFSSPLLSSPLLFSSRCMCCDCGKYRQSRLELGERRRGKESWRWKKESFDFGWMEDPSKINRNPFWSCGGDRRCNYIDGREMIGGRSIDFRSMFDRLFDRASIDFR